jgi:glycosyltransferase involved in cell wall biosynthesis
MKLIIQIPCLNEEATLPSVLASLPRTIPGITRIETQVIDDCSSDRTVEVARKLGVNHIIEFKHHRGLAAAFRAGVENALRHGADILVNTDGDGQYRGECVAALVQPIVRGEAELVIGARDIKGHAEFSWLKKQLQKFGSFVIRTVSGCPIADAASGFRAYGRTALMGLNVFSNFSYTMETLIQAGYHNLKLASVPILVNPKTRNSRLFRNMFHYLWRSGWTIINVFLIYRSDLTFGVLSLLSFLAGCALTVRYLLLVTLAKAPPGNFWPSIILAGCLLVLSIQFFLAKIQSTLIASNRKLLEEAIQRLREASMPLGDTGQRHAA